MQRMSMAPPTPDNADINGNGDAERTHDAQASSRRMLRWN